jgi:hypothetical protein
MRMMQRHRLQTACEPSLLVVAVMGLCLQWAFISLSYELGVNLVASFTSARYLLALWWCPPW